MPKREVAPEVAGYADVFDDIACATHDDCGYAVGFQVTSDQTDRLVAYRSRRYQQCDICLQISACFQCRWCVLFNGDALTSIGWHTDQLMREVAELAIC